MKRGQLIARIDPRLFESDVAQARANVNAAAAAVERARAELTNAKLQHERAESLNAQELTPRSDADAALAAYQSAEAQVTAAKASLAQARAALEQAETHLAYTRIVSPIDGIVISRDVDVGQTVAASLQAPTLFTIAEDLRKMELHTHVAEADVGRIERDVPVEFSVDAYPAERFGGVVREIRYAAQTVQNVVTYDAVVAVDNGELKLRPGMTADVAFLVEQRADVLLVPNASLRFQPPPEALQGGRAALPGAAQPAGSALAGSAPQHPGAASARQRVVWTRGERGRLRPLPVEIGVSDGQSTEVAGPGLAEGLEVITGLADGDASAAPARCNPRFGRFL